MNPPVSPTPISRNSGIPYFVFGGVLLLLGLLDLLAGIFHMALPAMAAGVVFFAVGFYVRIQPPERGLIPPPPPTVDVEPEPMVPPVPMVSPPQTEEPPPIAKLPPVTETLPQPPIAASPPAGAPSPAPALAEPPVSPAVVEDAPAREPWFVRLASGLKKTRAQFVEKLHLLFTGKPRIGPEIFEELEETLYEADLGDITPGILASLRQRMELAKVSDSQAALTLLKEEFQARLKGPDYAMVTVASGPLVVLVVGVNGVGKTTSIAKLSRYYRQQGKKVMMVAADTFRAAAIDQLAIWGQRVGATVIRGREGGDPAAVVFDGVQSAIAKKYDVLIVDTAGRLHTKANLMEELKKVRRVIQKDIPAGPHETLLVVDSTTGQNALVQAETFGAALEGLSGLILTKLDGTAKGGIIFRIREKLKIPVKWIGVGEGADDLQPFVAEEFINGLFESK